VQLNVVMVTLNQGFNEIRVTSAGGQGLNLDHVEFSSQ